MGARRTAQTWVSLCGSMTSYRITGNPGVRGTGFRPASTRPWKSESEGTGFRPAPFRARAAPPHSGGRWVRGEPLMLGNRESTGISGGGIQTRPAQGSGSATALRRAMGADEPALPGGARVSPGPRKGPTCPRKNPQTTQNQPPTFLRKSWGVVWAPFRI